MSRSGVLPFIRGINLTKNDLQEENFPKNVAEMVGLRWLRLDRTQLDGFPDEMSKLQKLESLYLQRNNLATIFGAIPTMRNLRVLNCRYNKLSSCPPDLGLLDELTVLDLSHNELREVPENLEKAICLTVLNLSYNRIESIPQQLFLNLVDLVYLDLSGNQFESLPPQMRRLVFLETLILNDNPQLENYQLKQLHSLSSLRTLHLRNSSRTLTNTPLALDMSSLLSDIDFSSNNLPRVPDMLYALKTLRRLNLSNNNITELSPEIGDFWKHLETLNVSRNKLRVLPNSICKCLQLRRLYVNENFIDFDGIPSGIGKLHNLEVFQAANNNLEMIPEGVVRCGRLKKLVLANNRLITVPEAIHLLTELEVLDLSNNPDLMMPPKPKQTTTSSAEFYNIDFSLQTQMRLAGAQFPTQLPAPEPAKDPIARKLRLRRRRGCADDEKNNQDKVLKGMKELATRKEVNGFLPETPESLKPKSWEDTLEKPQIDYTDLFEEDVGQMPGVFVWEIDNLLPMQIDDDFVGKFFEGDCYIILYTFFDESQNLNWKIHYWIGTDCTLDKKACSAIHAVHLRNFLGARCRTIRNEQGDESEDFLELFPDGIDYINGSRTQSGLYTVEEIEYTIRLYRVTASNATVHVDNMDPCVESLDCSFVFVLDAGLKIFVWSGRNSKCTVTQKGRLLAEKINKIERKDAAEIFELFQGKETQDFWEAIGIEDEDERKNVVIKKEPLDKNWKPIQPRLYQVYLGLGYLELLQVELRDGKLVKDLLETKNVYILDCITDMYIWWGKKSTKLVKSAAMKLGQELLKMMPRLDHVTLVRTLEGSEPIVFKTKFVGWDDVIAVDFTRTATSVARTGADLKKWMKTQETKVDLAVLFSPRVSPQLADEAAKFMEAANDDLDDIKCLVLEGKKFNTLPNEEFGHFYSQDCYVFMCRYWVPPEEEANAAEDRESPENNPEEIEESIKCVVYFWQGRDASNMGWLTFTFTMQQRFEQISEDKLEVQRTYQQQESDRFLSHFQKKFIIHTGARKERRLKTEPELFHIRANGSPIHTRCIQIDADAMNLNSAFCYILKVPFKNENSGVVYVWIGNKASADYIDVANEIAPMLRENDDYSLITLNEGEEPENFFWVGLQGKRDYDKDARYMDHLRLFRCSNDKGYFAVSEKCQDFCQDDLADDDIMILDDGEDVFIWVGSKCSEVEIKLALKSAQVYVQSVRARNPEQPRKLKLTLKGKESRRFKKCFHGWGKFKQVADWSG